MTKEAMQTGLTTNQLLMERCESDFLDEIGVISGGAAMFYKKQVKVNTKMLYVQNKFNLLREESEGYSKVITTLNRFGKDAITEESAKAEICTIQSLIGFFDLDPNRVFDLYLDCFESQLTNTAFLKLMPLFSALSIAHILGFKFQHYQRAS
eukprot:CAMPEP_0198227194 /NCGR_PEP_ID=MMETSP1445-20131203/108291_1 /TAXON_ID=36898 /ORGANISM="Pyramimonas sp., Strain CCMP2087" /LENGTH=151 /DNA_ID=CAMNT_0043907187 /DNA_START=3 /DNA_END=455 /DNA_ORIENTATION=+